MHWWSEGCSQTHILGNYSTINLIIISWFCSAVWSGKMKTWQHLISKRPKVQNFTVACHNILSRRYVHLFYDVRTSKTSATVCVFPGWSCGPPTDLFERCRSVRIVQLQVGAPHCFYCKSCWFIYIYMFIKMKPSQWTCSCVTSISSQSSLCLSAVWQRGQRQPECRGAVRPDGGAAGCSSTQHCRALHSGVQSRPAYWRWVSQVLTRIHCVLLDKWCTKPQ